MTSYRFFKMAAGSHIGFDLRNITIVGLSLIFKFGLDWIYRFEDTAIFTFRHFGLKLPIQGHFGGGGFRGIFPQMTSPYLYHFQVMADYWWNFFLLTGECLTLTPSLGVIPCEYPDKLHPWLVCSTICFKVDYGPKTRPKYILTSIKSGKEWVKCLSEFFVRHLRPNHWCRFDGPSWRQKSLAAKHIRPSDYRPGGGLNNCQWYRSQSTGVLNCWFFWLPDYSRSALHFTAVTLLVWSYDL